MIHKKFKIGLILQRVIIFARDYLFIFPFFKMIIILLDEKWGHKIKLFLLSNFLFFGQVEKFTCYLIL